MKIAHLTQLTTSGMMNSTIEEVAAEVKAGIDARLVFQGGAPADISVPVATASFKLEADICVVHSGVANGHECAGKPFFFVAHASPTYSFRLERMHAFTAYSIPEKLASHDDCQGIITYYEDHVPFWQNIAPVCKVFFIPPSVDLEKWSPGEAKPALFGEGWGDINIVSTSSWHEADAPFEACNAVFHFAERYPGEDVKLHIFGVGSFAGLAPLLDNLHKRDLMGCLAPKTDRLVDIYRSADMCITNHKVAARTVRECLACGCQLVGDEQLKVTPYRASRDSIKAYVSAMVNAYEEVRNDPETVSCRNRRAATDNFDPAVKAARYIELYENALVGREVAAC